MKKRVVSVLCFPYENALVVKVTRSTGYYDFPQTSKIYSLPYESSRLPSFAGRTGLLMMLHHKSMVKFLALKHLAKKHGPSSEVS